MPKVSVIVPVYNVERYLARCIDSLINQKLDDIEIIVVNDGSTDQSRMIAANYARRDSRIRIIDKVNGGLSSARNAGLEVVQGEYIAFVDSDDWLDINTLSEMYNIAIENNGDIVVFNFNIIDEATFKPSGDKGFSFLNGINHIDDYNRSQYIYEFGYGDNVCNKLYKRELIIGKNIKFEKNEEIYSEDLLFNLYCSCHVSVVCAINKQYYNRLIRKGSITQSAKKGLIKKYTRLVYRFEEYANYFGKEYLVKELVPRLFSTLIFSSSLYYLRNKSLIKELKRALVYKKFHSYLKYSFVYEIKLRGKWYKKIHKKIILKMLMLLYSFLSLFFINKRTDIID